MSWLKMSSRAVNQLLMCVHDGCVEVQAQMIHKLLINLTCRARGGILLHVFCHRLFVVFFSRMFHGEEMPNLLMVYVCWDHYLGATHCIHKKVHRSVCSTYEQSRFSLNDKRIQTKTIPTIYIRVSQTEIVEKTKQKIYIQVLRCGDTVTRHTTPHHFEYKNS